MTEIKLALIKPRQIRKVDEKTCTGCDKSKPIDQFRKRGDSPDGHESQCKTCYNNQAQARRDRLKAERNMFL